MPSLLKYSGRPADSDSSVTSQGTVTDRFNATSVNQAYVDEAVGRETTSLALKSYIDTQDAKYALKTTVDSADANYLPSYYRDLANGVATLDASGLVKTAQVPATRPDRVPVYYGITRWYLSGSTQISSTADTAVRLCEVTFTDPGWPYIPLVFGNFLCKGEEFTTFGRVIAKMNDGGNCGMGLSTALLEWHSVPVTPHGAYQQSPSSYTGANVVTFYASKYYGAGNQSVSSVNGFACVVLMPVF